ncbi:hypothetical protein PIB30_079257, partial [Stylosanthes scabra]|nr:hypothetical protein [Stylosanthes scabra]
LATPRPVRIDVIHVHPDSIVHGRPALALLMRRSGMMVRLPYGGRYPSDMVGEKRSR